MFPAPHVAAVLCPDIECRSIYSLLPRSGSVKILNASVLFQSSLLSFVWHTNGKKREIAVVFELIKYNCKCWIENKRKITTYEINVEKIGKVAKAHKQIQYAVYVKITICNKNQYSIG